MVAFNTAQRTALRAPLNVLFSRRGLVRELRLFKLVEEPEPEPEETHRDKTHKEQRREKEEEEGGGNVT